LNAGGIRASSCDRIHTNPGAKIMSWLNFAGKKRSAAQGFGNSPKRKSRKKSRSHVLERIVTPSAGVAGWLDDFAPLHHLFGSLSLPDLHLPNFLADSGVCPIAPPGSPTNNLPPLIDFDPLGLYHDGIATQSPYNPGGAFETLPIALIPIDPGSPNPKDPNAIRQLLDFPLASQPLVGTIDTGLNANSPYFNYANIKQGHDYVGGDDNPLLKAGEGSEHGTFMLGIIDAINKTAPKWVGRAIDSGKWADSLVEFVDAAKASGQKNAIANLSLDLTQKNADGSVTTRYELTPQERSAIEYARQNGVLLVAAAGNDGGVMSVLGQASQEFDNIITVGAGDINGRSIYSSFGRGLDIVADGGTSEHPALSTAGDDLGTMAGTSVATAKVSGAISLVWAANPGLSYRQVIEILEKTARDLGAPGWDDETGFGFLNTLAAVELAKKTAPEVYQPTAFFQPTTWGGDGIVTPSERAVNIVNENFTAWVVSSNGITLRNSPNTTDRSNYVVKTGDTLTFDGWTYGETLNDLTTGKADALWYRFRYNGGTYWVPSAWTGGYPGSLPPLQQQQVQPPPQSGNNGNWQTAIDNEYQQTRGLVGNPTSGYNNATTSQFGTTGKVRDYEYGTIHWTARYGAVALWRDLQREYHDLGGSGSWLGFPTKREYDWNGGKRTDFEGGYIYWDGVRAKAYRLGELPPTQSSPQQDIAQKFLYAASQYPQVGAAITGVQDQGGGVFRQEFERAIMIWNGQQVTVYETKGRSVSTTSPSPNPQPVNNLNQSLIAALRTAIIGQESGYNYRAVNPDSRALGFAQVLPGNIPSWSREALGYEITPEQFLNSPDLQLKVVDYKLNQYYKQAIAASGGNVDIAVRRVASAWYSGHPELYTSTTPQYTNGVQYPSIANYTLSVLGKFQQAYGGRSVGPTGSVGIGVTPIKEGPIGVDGIGVTPIDNSSYMALYVKEMGIAIQQLNDSPLGSGSQTTWLYSNKYGENGAQKMLDKYKNFLIEAAQNYGIDPRAIAGAIRWEYEVNTDSRNRDYAWYLAAKNNQILGSGSGWGKMHFSTAREILSKEGLNPTNSELADILAVAPSAIDMIGKYMREAVNAYKQYAGVDIHDKPEILTTLYQGGNYEQRAKELGDRRSKGIPPLEPQMADEMGPWVKYHLDELGRELEQNVISGKGHTIP
jgi:hypothetical protein